MREHVFFFNEFPFQSITIFVKIVFDGQKEKAHRSSTCVAPTYSMFDFLHLVGQVFTLLFNSCAGWSLNGRQRKSEKSWNLSDIHQAIKPV